MAKSFPQMESSHVIELSQTNSPERHLFISILQTYVEDVDAFFLFVNKCKTKNELFDAKSISKIKRNNYFVENLTTVLNLVNTNYKTNPQLLYGNLHCEMICDFAGIDYTMFRERLHDYVKNKAKEFEMNIEDLLISYKFNRVVIKDKK